MVYVMQRRGRIHESILRTRREPSSFEMVMPLTAAVATAAASGTSLTLETTRSLEGSSLWSEPSVEEREVMRLLCLSGVRKDKRLRWSGEAGD